MATRGGSWVGLLGSGGRFSRRTQGVWGAGPPTAGGEPDVFFALKRPHPETRKPGRISSEEILKLEEKR